MIESFIILLLILINCIFSLAETAFITSNKIRLENEAEEGDKEAEAASKLINSSYQFLFTIRIVVTMSAVMIGLLSGISLSKYLEIYLNRWGAFGQNNHIVSYIITILITGYIFLVLGELVPRRLAAQYPEKIAKKLAGVFIAIAKIGAPFVWALSKSANIILYLFGIKSDRTVPSAVSEEEITAMIEKATESGTFEAVEQDIVERLFFLSDRNVGSLMTSKMDVVSLDIRDKEETLKKIQENNFVYYPVYEKEIDNIIGVLNTKKVLTKLLSGEEIDIRSLLAPPLFVHDKLDALKLIDQFKKAQTDYAIVVDEFGSFSGIVTLNDLFKALIGDVNITPEVQPEIVQRDENTWLVDGVFSFDEFLRHFDLEAINIHKENDFYTLSGFVMFITRHIPKTGETFTWENYLFEVVDMDGLRVDKVMVTKLTEEPTEKEE